MRGVVLWVIYGVVAHSSMEEESISEKHFGQKNLSTLPASTGDATWIKRPQQGEHLKGIIIPSEIHMPFLNQRKSNLRTRFVPS